MTLGASRVAVLISTLLVLTGWTLSWMDSLTPRGFAIALVVVAGVALACSRAAGWSINFKGLRRWRFRIRHWLPAGFALSTLLIIIGGLIHAPNNFDSLSYRVPRVLHWMAESHWYWIDTNYVRLNTRSFVTEWSIAPILALTHSDRSIWLINFGMFLLLPGLIFSAFRGLGVGMRASWHWMWLIACADGVILQAGGAANDLPALFYAVASIAFAISARRNKCVTDAWLALLSAALLTGLKPTNATFGLFWLLVTWPALKLLISRPLASAVVVAVAISVSFIPSAVINHRACGDWTGASVELPHTKEERSTGLVLAANSVALVSGNLMPTVFPWSSAWANYWDTKLSPSFREEVARIYGATCRLADVSQMPMEELSGLGFGLSWLAILSGLSVWRWRPMFRRTLLDHAILVSPWIGVLAIAALMPATGMTRYALAFYPFLLLPILLQPGFEGLTRKKWWRWLAGFSIINAALVLIISPVRPLWPAATVFKALADRPNPPALVLRARDVYSTFGNRWDALAPVRDLLPKDARLVGLVSHNDVEASLWRPFGSRRIQHVPVGESIEKLKARNLDYLIVNESLADSWFPGWANEIGMERTNSVFVKELASAPPMKWTLFRKPAPAISQLPHQIQ